MPTKDQYDFFKQVLSEEDLRNGILVKRGEIYLSLISLLLTGLIFKLTDLRNYLENNANNRMVFSLVLISLFGSAIFTMISLQIRSYTGVNLAKWTDELGDIPLTNTEFYTNRIADFIAIVLKNQEINNKRGRQLKIAGYFLLISILLIGFLLFLILVL